MITKMSKNDKEFYYGINGIFERFPELIPAVGEHYYREDGLHKKLMLVAESNYLGVSDEKSVFRNAEVWYEGDDTTPLIPDEKKIDFKNWKYAYPPFRRAIDVANQVLIDNGIKSNGEQDEISFYNYFLRPADSDRKIRPLGIDYRYSGVAMEGVIQKLEPDVIVFLSSNACNSFMKYMQENCISHEDTVICSVVHPSSMWWWRNSGIYGHKKLYDILERNWISRR